MEVLLAVAVVIVWVGGAWAAVQLCDAFGAPLWFAKFLYCGICITATYFLAKEGADGRTWLVWFMTIGGSFPPILFSVIWIADLEKRRGAARAQ